MEILRALQIAKREWENIRISLEVCGDIGEFNSINHVNSKLTIVSEGLLLVRKLIEMDNKLSTHGYFTPEAAYVFTALGSRAGERLGLIGGLAQAFGSVYSWVRTGWFDSNGTEGHCLRQKFFFEFFFLPGEDFTWDFNSSVIKVRLKTVFDKFVVWQDASGSYI